MRKGRERRRAGVFLAEGRREVERAAAAGLVAPRHLLRARVDPRLAARGRGERTRARTDELPRRAGRRARRRSRSRSGALPAGPTLVARRGRDREARQPRRDGAHRRRGGRRRAARRRRRASTRGTRTRFALRPAPSSRSRSSRRRATSSPRCRTRRSPRCSARLDATPTLDLHRTDRVPDRRRGRRPRRRLARASPTPRSRSR